MKANNISATAPAAEKTAVTLPFRLPTSALLSAIRDPDARRLLAKEEELRRKRGTIRDELRVVQDGKDKSMRELRPNAETFRNDLATALGDLHNCKDELYHQLDAMRGLQDGISHARDELRGHSFRLTTLNRDISDAEMLLRDEQRELDRLEKVNDTTRADAQRKRIAKFVATVQEKSAERKKVEAERQLSKAAIERLAGPETPEQRNERFKDVRAQIAEVQAEIAEVKKRRSQRPENAAIAELLGKQSELHEELNAVDARIDSIRRDLLPVQHFTYPPDSKMEIVGRGGATLRQLQIDFGVAVCVDMVDAGHGFVIGGAADVAACVAAIQGLVAGASEAAVETESVPFPSALKRQIIGARGATIDSFERESGARLRVLNDCVEVSGTADVVDAARAMLEEFVDSLGSTEMPFEAARMSQVLGKGGATITQVERESGVRWLRVDRQRHRLQATGSQAAIAKAFALYKAILGEVAGGAATVQGTEQLVRAVVGPKGRTVRGIEEATGARVSCGAGHVIEISGAPEAVKAAVARVEALRRSEVRVVADWRVLNFLTAPVVRVASTAAVGSSELPLLSPLEAVQRATGCDQVIPLRSEGVVVIRGRAESSQRAALMVKHLMLYNPPHVLRVPYTEVLRAFLLRRQTAERGSSLLDQITKHYSPFLHIDIDRDSRTLLVCSNDLDEAHEAGRELGEMLKDLVARQVRVLDDFPSHLVGQLIGPAGSNIRELQEATGTEIAVLGELGQVQIFSPEGDRDTLERAVAYIKRDILHEPVDQESTGGAEGEGDGVSASA